MKKTIVTVKGYTLNPYKNFEDDFVVYSANGLLELLNILEADGIRIEWVIDKETGEYYFTAGQVEAMGHNVFGNTASDKRIFVYKAVEGRLSYNRMF